MESFKELSEICQKPHYKTRGNWMVRHLLRDAALPITWVLLHTPVTANQVTLLAILVGLVGNFYLSVLSHSSLFVAALLLQLWYLLDHVDGQIARYRKTASLTGRFYDFLMHHMIHATVFFPWGWFLWQETEESYYLILGFIMSMMITLFNMLPDIVYKAYIEKVQKEPHIKLKERISEWDVNPKKSKQSLFKKGYAFIHKSCEMHVMMNLLTLCGAIQCFLLRDVEFRFALFWFYFVALVLLVPTKISFLILSKKPDQEFGDLFES